MSDFQYQPPTGPLSGSEFERQTTRFFQQVQEAAALAQSAASAAQVTANEALERAQAPNLVDGKTTQADASGKITVKDVAIGGDISDLASARGIFDSFPSYYSTNHDLNSYLKQGVYFFYSEAVSSGSNFPIALGGTLVVYASTNQYVKQFYFVYNGAKCFSRIYHKSVWNDWTEYLNASQIGDGIRVTNGIISVPEYEGATASEAATSGLVPPAAAGQADYVLCGDGEWRDIATLVAAAQARLADEKTS